MKGEKKAHKKLLKTKKIRARDRHRANLMSYLSVWENEWPKNRIEMAAIIGIKPDTLRFHFSPAELNEIYAEGLELRKKNSFKQRKIVYDSMLEAAENGNVAAQKEFLDRTEGKITDKIQHGFDATSLNAIFAALPEEYAEAVRAQLSEIIKK